MTKINKKSNPEYKEDIPTINWEPQGPGKFEGGTDLDTYLYDLTMESGTDEELGEVEHFGWYGLFNGVKVKDGDTGKIIDIYAIVHEDNQGFFSTYEYDTEKELMDAWKDIQEEYDEFMEEAPEEEEESRHFFI